MVTGCGVLSGPARQGATMNHTHRIGRSLASLSRRASFPLARHAVVRAVAAITQPEPPRWTTYSPPPATARLIAASGPRVGARPQAPPARPRATAAAAWLPHTVQLCIHCRENPAGFWVSRTGSKTTRRPWCLSCCQGLDQNRCDIVPFGG
jgi:hypothetical protein